MAGDTASNAPQQRSSLENQIQKLMNARTSLGHVMNDTLPLEQRDYELIGKFVQTYCTGDLEARRVINALTHIRTGKSTNFALKLNDKDTLGHLEACSKECVWNLDLAEGIGKAAEIFVQHRHLRHMFTHWAGRRIAGHDVFIFFTASFGKQKPPNGAIVLEEQADANLQYCVMPISNLVEELEKLQGHARYLATIGVQLEARAPEISVQFAKDKASGRF
jgi:hypothetical protein